MADIDKAIRALRAADAAGDKESARKIATAIKGMQVPAAREETTDKSGMAAFATQGALASFGDEYMAGLSAALGVQPDGNGGANWFQYEKPLRERYNVALGAIRGEMAQYQDENPWKAGGAQVAGAIGTAVAAAPKVAQAGRSIGLKPAVTAGGRVKQVVAGGVGAGAIEGFGAGEGGFTERAKSSGVGAVVGGIFAPVVGFGMSKIARFAEQKGGKALRSVFTNRRMFDRKTGELTGAGKKRLAMLGVDDIGALSQEMQQAFGVAAEKTVNAADDLNTGAAVSRIAAAERFGVPITRGQATGDVLQTATEENMRAGTRGQGAMATLGGFDEIQGNAVESARSGIVRSGTEFAPNRIDAAESVISGVKREAETARQAGSQAYKALEDSGAALSGKEFPVLRGNIETAVRAEGVPLDAGTPNAMAAVNVLESAFSGAERGAVPFGNIERARQRILGFQRASRSGSNGADRVAIDTVVKQFDGWLDDTITGALISGDGAVLSQAKEARGLWGKYRSTFLGTDGADNFIRKIVEDDLAPDQVAGWLYGASTNIGGGQSSLVAKRVKSILGEASPEWQEVKRAGWDRLTTATEGRDAFGPQRIASNISELLNGKGQTLGRELYTDQEREVMAQFRDMLKVLVPPKKATNPSGSSYDLQRATRDMVKSMGVILGGASGGPVGAVGAAVGQQAIEQGTGFAATMQARAATRGIVLKPASTPVAIGAGVGTGAALQDKTVR